MRTNKPIEKYVNMISACVNDMKTILEIKDSTEMRSELLPVYAEMRDIMNEMLDEYAENILYLVKGDITKFHGGAVVNAANSDLTHGAGVCGAIFSAAGTDLDDACTALRKQYGPIHVGAVCETESYNMCNVRKIIHAIGPIYKDGKSGEPNQLYSAYQNAIRILQIMREASYDIPNSIAFPFISTGIYGYPKKTAAEIAVRAIAEYAGSTEVTMYAFSDEDYDIIRNALRNYARLNFLHIDASV